MAVFEAVVGTLVGDAVDILRTQVCIARQVLDFCSSFQFACVSVEDIT